MKNQRDSHAFTLIFSGLSIVLTNALIDRSECFC